MGNGICCYSNHPKSDKSQISVDQYEKNYKHSELTNEDIKKKNNLDILNEAQNDAVKTKSRCENKSTSKNMIMRISDNFSKSFPMKKIHKILRKKVIIIGQSGHGKSTFINAVINYSYKRNPRNFFYISDTEYHLNNFNTRNINKLDPILEKITEDLGVTTDCTSYKLKNNIEIIDTPGVSDKNGFEQDNLNINKILKFARESCELAGIIYLVNSTQARLDPSLKNSLNRLSAIIPREFLNSVLVVYTFSPKRKKLFRSEWLPFNPDGEYFLDLDIFNLSEDEITENFEDISKSWLKICSEISKIFEKIEMMVNKNVIQYEIMYKEYNNSKLHYSKIKDCIHFMYKIKKIINENLSISNFLEDLEIDQVYYTKKDYYSTICLICKNVCHKNCRIERNKVIDTEYFIDCQMIVNDGRCSECNCLASNHYQSSEVPKIKRVQILEMMKDFIKCNCEQAKLGTCVHQLKNKDMLENKIEDEIKKSKSRLVESARLMKPICPKFNMREMIITEIDSVKKMLTNTELLKAIYMSLIFGKML